MKDSKLFLVLASFSEKERQKIYKFICSPFVNEHQGIVRLGNYLLVSKAQFEDISTDKFEIFQQVFSDEDYDDLRLRHLFSDFLRLIEKYLAITNLIEDDIQMDLSILSVYRNKGLDKHFEGYRRKLDSSLKKDKLFSAKSHHQRYLLEAEINDYLSQQSIKKGNNNVESSAAELDIYFIINKLRYACMQLNLRNVYAKDYQLFLLDEILHYITKQNFLDNATIKIYYNIYMMLKNPENESFFSSLKETLYSSIQNFSLDEAKELYAFAQNYCTYQINSGNASYFLELHELNKVGLERKILLHKGELDHRHFMNVVTVACSLKEFDWALYFIENFKKYVRVQLRENVYTYNMAQYYWYLKDYSKVLKLCSRVEYDEPFYFVNSRSMMLKIYFEQNEFEAFFSLGESFRIYLNRNKLINETTKSNLWNLIKYATRLIKIDHDSAHRLEKIKQDVVDTKNVNSKAWLLQQIGKKATEFIEKDA